MKRVVTVGILWGALFAVIPSSRANTVLFTWGGTDSGQVTFSTINCNPTNTSCNLEVDLYDTGAEVQVNADFLAGLSFNIQQGTTNGVGGTTPTLQYYSATAMNGFMGTAENGTDICAPGGLAVTTGTGNCASAMDGGWEALYSSTGYTGLTGDWAIGTTGFAKLGKAFNGKDTGSFDNSLVPTSGSLVTDKEPYVVYHAQFVLTGLTSNSIYVSGVQALYGTGPDTTPTATLINGEVPEPHTVVMISGALLLLLLKRRRR